MRVLVTGGTGFIGRNLCRELVDRGHVVTAFSRDPDPGVVPEGVETVGGDVTDEAAVSDVVEGHEGVVHLVALSPLFKPRGPQGHHEVHVGGTRQVVGAMERHGVEPLVHMSGLGTDQDVRSAHFRAKHEAEEIVAESEVASVVFRPSLVFGDGDELQVFTKRLTTPYLTGLPGGGFTRFQPIWVGDLVPLLADALETDAHSGEVYEIGGPEVLTLADVTRLVYRAEGKSVRIIPIPMVLVRVGLTLAGPIPFVPFGVDQYWSLYVDSTVEDNGVAAFGVSESELRTFEDYLGLGVA